MPQTKTRKRTAAAAVAVAPAPVSAPVQRKKFRRDPDRIDAMTLKALQKIQASKGDAFRVGVATIMQNFDQRLKVLPSPATVYRAIERLSEAGAFSVERNGERGNFTYRFNGSVAAPASPVAPAESPVAAAVSSVLPTPASAHSVTLADILPKAQAAIAELRATKAENEALKARIANLESELTQVSQVFEGVVLVA